MARALNEALRDSLGRRPRMLVLGEDVGKLGGVFRITDGLQGEFGEGRVFDTPLAEAAIAGVSVGLAHRGLTPSRRCSSRGSPTRRWTRSSATSPSTGTGRGAASRCRW